MSAYKLFAAKTLTVSEESLYSRTDGFIIKTIMLYNPSDSQTTVSFKFDSILFNFELQPKEVKTLSDTVFCKTLSASGNGVSVHISGLQE